MYTLYGSPQSLFTRKMETAMTFYGAPFTSVRKRGSGMEKEIEARSGTHQIPVLQTPENWMIADTTPLMQLMDSRYPRCQMFPTGYGGVLVHLVEEYFDEWISRVMVHYRWNYPKTADVVSQQIGNGDEQVAKSIREWGPRSCRATGTGTPELGKAAEAEYDRLLAAMESQLRETSYLMGNQPTAVDCAALGGLYAHMLNDPDPLIMIQAYPGVIEWAEGQPGVRSKAERTEIRADLTPFARHVLEEMARAYRLFLLGNCEAMREKKKSFVVETFGIRASYLTRAYPERSHAMLTHRIANLVSKEEQQQTGAMLDHFGLADCFSPSR